MNLLIVATSKKPASFEEEVKQGLRYRVDYLRLCDYLNASYVDYDSPWMHANQVLRRIEERIHLDFYWAHHIAKLVKDRKYDVVISMSERIAVPLGLLLPRGIKHIALLENATSQKWLNLIRTSKVYQKWDKVAASSYGEAEALKQSLKIDPDQLTTIHHCVDSDFYNPSIVKTSQQSNEPFILSQGLTNRDYPTLIRALWKLPHVKCHISAVSAWDKYNAGYGGLQIPDNLSIKSYDHPSEIRNALRQCKFLVIPLRAENGKWCAGSSSVLEAQAMEKPVILTNLPGISEYIRENKTGFLVDGNDPDQLAEKIDFLWQNSNEAKLMGSNAAAWVRESFSTTNWINKITEVLTEVSRP